MRTGAKCGATVWRSMWLPLISRPFTPVAARWRRSRATPTTHHFTGQRKDAGSGLLFYNARWYDPQVGRFLSPDTLVPNPGDPQSLNRYSYVGNRPTGYRDPTGHAQITDADGGYGGAIAVAAGYAGAEMLARWGGQLAAAARSLAVDVVEFAASPLGQLALQHAQQADAAANQAASNADNTSSSGGMGPNDPWDKFNQLLGQGNSQIDAAVQASTRGSGDRFVIGPYSAPAGTLNYIDEAKQFGGKFFDAGNKLWSQMAQKGIAGQVNRQVIYEQMKAGIGRIDISSGLTISQILANPDKYKSLTMEVQYITDLANKLGYVVNATGTGWVAK